MIKPFIQPNINVREHVSPEEWEARVNLAACYRLIDWYGMSDHISNHVTVRVPGTQNEFLINPYGIFYDQMTASCMIRIDIEGNILFNPSEGYEVNRSGYIIHGAIHKARHDVDCIIHTHTLTGMTVASMQCGLLPSRKCRCAGSKACRITITKVSWLWTSANAWCAILARTTS